MDRCVGTWEFVAQALAVIASQRAQFCTSVVQQGTTSVHSRQHAAVLQRLSDNCILAMGYETFKPSYSCKIRVDAHPWR